MVRHSELEAIAEEIRLIATSLSVTDPVAEARLLEIADDVSGAQADFEFEMEQLQDDLDYERSTMYDNLEINARNLDKLIEECQSETRKMKDREPTPQEIAEYVETYIDWDVG